MKRRTDEPVDKDALDGCALDFDTASDEDIKKFLLPRNRKVTYSEEEWEEKRKHGT